MIFCKDCEYLKLDRFCEAPNNGVSLVSGKNNTEYAYSFRRTNHPNSCGIKAKFFKQKRPWWKIWKTN